MSNNSFNDNGLHYEYIEYGDNNTTVSGSYGSSERFIVGEPLRQFNLPVYYAEAKYEDVIAYIPKGKECIWYWVKRNNNRNAAILSCYHSSNGGAGSAPDNCANFLKLKFHNDTVFLSERIAVPKVEDEIYGNIFQRLIEYGVDNTLRIIPAYMNPNYCLSIIWNVLNALPSCIANKISYTINASNKTTTTFSFLSKEEWGNSQRKIDCRGKLSFSENNGYIKYLLNCIRQHGKDHEFESIINSVINPDTNPPLLLYQMLYQLFMEKNMDADEKIIKFYSKHLRMDAYKRELAKKTFISESSNQENEGHNVESQKKFVSEATKASVKPETPHNMPFKDFKARENSSIYIPIGLKSEEQKSIKNHIHEQTSNNTFSGSSIQNQSDTYQATSEKKEFVKDNKERKDRFLKKIFPISIISSVILVAGTVGVILVKKNDLFFTNSLDIIETIETKTQSEVSVSNDFVLETEQSLQTTIEAENSVQESTTEESITTVITTKETTAVSNTTEITTKETTAVSENEEYDKSHFDEITNSMGNEIEYSYDMIKTNEEDIKNFAFITMDGNSFNSASEIHNFFINNSKSFSDGKEIELKVSWHNDTYEMIYIYNVNVEGYCFLLKKEYSNNIIGCLYESSKDNANAYIAICDNYNSDDICYMKITQ